MSGPMVVVTDPRRAQPAGVTPPVAGSEPVVLARAEWSIGDSLPQIAGFVVSNFNPLVAEVAERCLRAHYGTAPADPVRGVTTGVVLASVRGDVTTVDTVAAALRDGRRVPPLLFFQSNPNAVVGHVTARWGLAGPVVCTSPSGDPLADGLAVAALLIEDEAATEVLVIAADLADGADERDHAVAVLVAGTQSGEE
jgi:Beta-ketoacyl synthase, N-terminal domain